MSWLVFAGGNLIVLLTAYFLTRRRGLAPAEKFLAIFAVATGQIVFTMLLAGTVLRLTITTLLVLNLILLAAAILLGHLFPGPNRAPVTRPDVSWRHNFWARLLLFLALLETAWLIFLGYLFPPYAWDSLYYHLTAVATWLQSGRIVLSPYTLWANVYPMNTELIFAWNMLFSGSDLLVDLTQLPFALAGGLAVYALGRETGLQQANSAVAACLFFLTPIVLVQSKTCYVDVAFAAMFLAAFYFAYRYYHCPRRVYLLLAALASGLIFGMKASAAPYVATVFLLIIAGNWMARRATNHPFRQSLLPSLVILSGALLLWGSFWYLRNWLAYGNPLFPFTFKVLGYTLWSGQGSVADLVMVKNMPPELAGLPAWQQLLRSWQETSGPYTFDQRLGGFGPQWLYLELPALAVTFILALARGHRRLLLLLLPLVLLFWLQPSNWWTRYTIFIVAAGTLSLAYLEERLPGFWARPLRAATLALVIISLAGSLTHGYFTPQVIGRFLALPPEQRTFFQLTPWGDELAWVARVPPGSRIAFTETAFPYLLFGPRLENRVYRVIATSEEDMLRQLRENNSQYFLTTTTSAYYHWAQRNSQIFQPFFSYGDYVAFKVLK
ncbi:glycosyltransferase family 39 protein [Neomoorella glycerini]|uniref:glycosyltransferase family 39 protein n=1 Tax=Neomoorella glycerini TaxID=55779 RepID=UPI0014795762|nr:glycosyltransferase family 39 protein [Moorella glycerini]